MGSIAIGSYASPMKLAPSNDWICSMLRFRANLVALLSAQLVLFPQLLKSQDGVGRAAPDAVQAGVADIGHSAAKSSRRRTATASVAASEDVVASNEMNGQLAIHLTFSDSTKTEGDRYSIQAIPPESEPCAAEEAGHTYPHQYPSQVSHDPGVPRKPHCERPGDINASDYPPIRYCQDDCFRAGWPHAVRKWATCSINPHYSAGYVGGGSAWIFPHGRWRKCEEGTWGLDYSLLSRPKMVWMNWTQGREQGGLGAYATDH